MDGNKGIVLFTAHPDDPEGKYVPVTAEEALDAFEGFDRGLGTDASALVLEACDMKDFFQVRQEPGTRKPVACNCDGKHVCTACGAECGASTACPDCGHDCACMGNKASLLATRELKQLHGIARNELGRGSRSSRQ